MAHVVGETEHDFWGTIPPGSDIFGHETSVPCSLGRHNSRVLAWRRITTGQTKVADFKLAI